MFSLSVLSLVLVSCNKDYHGTLNETFYSKPVQTLSDITLHRSKDGKVIAILNAPKVEAYSGDSSKTVFPSGLKVTFLNDDLSTKTILTARYAIAYDSSDLVYIKDSVKIINLNSKDTIYSQELYWNKTEKLVYTYTPIRRYSTSGQDFGDGMFSNEVFDSVTIINPRGSQTVEED